MAHGGVFRDDCKGWLWSTSLLTLLVLLFLPSVTSIECYKCTKELSNEKCSQAEHLVNCDTESSASRTLDTCQTITQKIGGELRITKRCVAGPCTLGSNQDNALGLNDCNDSDRCEACCQKNGCNKAGAAQIRPSSTLMVISVLLFTLFTLFTLPLSCLRSRL